MASENSNQTAAQSDKDMRNSSLRMLAEIWQRFPEACDYSHAWVPFAELAEPLLDRTSIEVSFLAWSNNMPCFEQPFLWAVLYGPGYLSCWEPGTEETCCMQGPKFTSGL